MTAPTIVDSGRVTGSYSSPSFTFTIPTISSGCDLLVCLFSIGFANTTARDQTPSALTVGGNAMTVAAESYWAHAPTNRHVSLAIAYYKNPSSGSSVDVVYTPTQDFSSNSINMQFYTLTGTDSTTPIGNTGSAGPTDGGDSVTLATTVADSLIVGVGTVPDATNPSNATITWTSPAVEEDENQRPYFTPSCARLATTSTGNYTLEGSETGGYNFVMLAAVVNAVGSTSHILDGNPVAVPAPTVSSGSLGQDHALDGNPVDNAAPVVSAGTVAQDHVLDGNPVAVPAPVVSVGTVIPVLGLNGNPVILPGPVVSSGALAQRHALAGTGVDNAAPVVSVAVLILFLINARRLLIVRERDNVLIVARANRTFVAS